MAFPKKAEDVELDEGRKGEKKSTVPSNHATFDSNSIRWTENLEQFGIRFRRKPSDVSFLKFHFFFKIEKKQRNWGKLKNRTNIFVLFFICVCVNKRKCKERIRIKKKNQKKDLPTPG